MQANLVELISIIGAAIAVSFGAIGPALAEGRAVAAAMEAIARLTAEARQQIARERQEAFAALAAEMARRALCEPLPGRDGIARHLDALPEEEREDLAADLRADDGAVTVVAAAELPAEERAAWQALLRARFGARTRVRFSSDPELIAGVELHFPHASLRFSLADRLRRIASELEAGT